MSHGGRGIPKFDRGREQELLERMIEGDVSRRQFLVRGGAGVLAFGGLASLLAACGEDDEGSGGGAPAGSQADRQWTPAKIREQYGSQTIGDSWHTLALAIIADRARGGELAAKAMGQKYAGYSNDVNTAKQTSDVQNAVNSGVKFINTVPIDAPVVNNIAETVKAAGAMFTTTYNNPAWKTPVDYGPEYVTYFAPDDRETGRLTARNLAEHLGGEGRIVHLTGVKGATADQQRTLGVDDALQEYPNIELVARVATDWTTVDAQKKMQNLLSTNDDIDGVIGQDDDVGIGAYNAIRVAGKEIPIVSSDGIDQAFKLIEESFYLGTVNTYTYWLGGYAVVRAFDALHGWKPEVPETMMSTQITWVDKATAGKVRKAFFGGGDLPYNFPKMSRVLYPDDWDTQQELVPIDPNVLWESAPKPSGYELPAGYDKASRDKIAKLYRDHWTTRDFA